jgi:hypothetical protein
MDPRLDLPNNERQELLSLRTLSDEQGFRSYNVIFDGCTTGEIDLYAWDHLKWIRFYPFLRDESMAGTGLATMALVIALDNALSAPISAQTPVFHTSMSEDARTYLARFDITDNETLPFAEYARRVHVGAEQMGFDVALYRRDMERRFRDFRLFLH